jgi:hypothetical protein
MDGLKVNFSTEEAGSEARSFDALPSGKYESFLTDIELRESKSEKNFGKPYWAAEFTVSSGPYETRKFWGNIMLFEGALYSLAQLLKATGFEEALGTGIVPDPDLLIGKPVLLNVKKQRDTFAEERDGDGTPQFKNEIKGYMTMGSAAAGPTANTPGTKSATKKDPRLP